jgi:hypothetical protein
VVLWTLLLLLCSQFARAERRRFGVLLGCEHPGPARQPAAGQRVAAFWRRFADLDTWKHFLYALLRFPLGMAEAVILAGLWSIALAMVALPGYDWLLPRRSRLPRPRSGWTPRMARVTSASATDGRPPPFAWDR